jgi:predicted RNA-binding protein with PUA-like domain
MARWLVKTEPNSYSIEDLRRDGTTLWDGVRNYQARNFLTSMKVSDLALVYHSGTDPIGVVGVARVVEAARPDPTQFDQESRYFDPAATVAQPRWFCPLVGFVEQFGTVVERHQLQREPLLAKMEILRKGSRLSVTPLTDEEFDTVLRIAHGGSAPKPSNVRRTSGK